MIHVSGRLLTQEQRGASELVICNDTATGSLIWMHKDAVPFSDVVSGAKPRATPEYANGRVCSHGSKAILTCLDAETGERRWQGSRYGFGQMLLLEAQGQLIVAAENEDLVLINARPQELDEDARISGVSGKTWRSCHQQRHADRKFGLAEADTRHDGQTLPDVQERNPVEPHQFRR